VELEQVTTNRVRLHCHSAPRSGLTNERGRATAIEMPATVKTTAMTPSVPDLLRMKSMGIAPWLDVQSVHLAGRSFMRSDKSPRLLRGFKATREPWVRSRIPNGPRDHTRGCPAQHDRCDGHWHAWQHDHLSRRRRLRMRWWRELNCREQTRIARTAMLLRNMNFPFVVSGMQGERSQPLGLGAEGWAGTVPAGHWGLCNCPLSIMCVRTSVAPRGSRFTISQIGGMIGA
jgi:hypothetical protein